MSLWTSYLPRMPRSHWEGWFLIAIGDGAGEVRWTKTTIFRARRQTPLAAVEGLTAEGQVETLVGFADHIVTAVTPFKPEELDAQRGEFALALGDALRLRARGDTVQADLRGVGLSVTARAWPVDRLGWAALPPALHYFGMHGPVEATVDAGGRRSELRGLGVVEHAWGASLPFNVARLVPGRWHWDVLRFGGEPDESPASAAGLWLTLPGAGMCGVRGFARFPGGPFLTGRPKAIAYLHEEATDGRRFPTRWRACIATPAGRLDYEAQSTTPLSPSAPGGGFFGFAFTGTFHPTSGSPRDVRGTGFTECGGPG